MNSRFAAAGWLAAALAGCSFPSGESERKELDNQVAAARAAAGAGAGGKAEEGRLSIQAPGVDIAISVPEEMRNRARAGADTDVLPPGARISGLHVQGDGGAGSDGSDSVELRFVAAQPPAEVAAWYRDPARRRHFRIDAARREGEELVLSGTNAQSGGALVARIRPRADGGTDGRLVLAERD